MSQTFCGQCGALVQGAFCGSCGAPVPAAAPTPPPPAPPTYAAPPAPPQAPVPPTYPAPPAYPAPTAPPAAPPPSNPLAAVTVRDVILDMLALVLLLTSLALPWDFASSASSESGWNDINDRWWVILSLVIAIFGIAVPYLGASRAIPGLTQQLVLLVKLGTVLPVALSLFFLVLFECIHVTHDDKGGIGAGAVMLSVAALLVLVPRAFDDLPGLHRGARTAESVLYAVAAAALVITLVVDVIRIFTGDDSDFFGGAPGWTKALTALLAVVSVVPFLVPAATAIRGGSVWAPVAAAVVAAYVFTSFFNGSIASAFGGADMPTFVSLGGEKLSLPGSDSVALGYFGTASVGIGVLVVAAAVVLLAGRWQAADRTIEQRAGWWVRVASTAGLFAAGVGALILVHDTVVYAITKANNGESHVNGTWIACMVLLAVVTVVAGLTGLFARRFAEQKLVPVLLAGAWFFLGFVLAIVTSTADHFAIATATLVPMATPEVFAVLFAPLLVLGALTVPTAVRRTYGAVVSLARINAAGR
ncbi:MAG TPA: hypothetical protein VJ872_15575 [Nocardioides sp.]|nr:hypothetical protein [Nocardioides sp.]